jgi:hypothetical protein
VPTKAAAVTGCHIERSRSFFDCVVVRAAITLFQKNATILSTTASCVGAD